MPFGRRRQETLFDPTKVDLVAEASDGAVELVIVADSPWTGSDAQLSSLQEKVQSYVSYALDGGLSTSHPEVAGRPWRILVHSQVGEPDERTQQVLAGVADRLPTYGGSLTVRSDI
ncbi:DUF6572 domain-containing protein [Nocardioides halotolerans]|uniref:DUF6572 domain-containing protein n=1 Tax=Nocardioides halotolerans TaxID=433660 RepID=UPI00048DC96E|nr:DUF6572 domain-containing protein [Nocardioides halotolerans]